MFTITKTIGLVALSLLVFSSFMLYSYALPKDPKWGTEGYCLGPGKQLSGQKYLTCCWQEIGPSPDASEGEREVTRCQTCWYDVNGQPDNCGDIYEPRHNEEVSPGASPTEGVSDDPKAGNDHNPGVPPIGDVVDETENQNIGNENENENENDDTLSNTIPRKGGDLDISDLNENVIVQ